MPTMQSRHTHIETHLKSRRVIKMNDIKSSGYSVARRFREGVDRSSKGMGSIGGPSTIYSPMSGLYTSLSEIGG